MSQIAIRVSNLGKRYRIGATSRGEMLRMISSRFRRPSNSQDKDFIWALRDIAFEVTEGEAIGLIGLNGAGKSTLLKILSRITKPTTGHAEIFGRVGSLLEVGIGFHPELSGRENIFLNGGMLGMSRKEIRRKFDNIVEFSEIAKFVDVPVKRYSSGMYIRLAFSVAAFLQTEILLVDEVLAVGDVRFQKKCLGHMKEEAQTGRTVIFVSHNIAAIAAICTRAILLEAGRVTMDGACDAVVSYSRDKWVGHVCDKANLSSAARSGSGKARFSSLTVTAYSPDGNQLASAYTGCDLLIEVVIESNADVDDCNAAVMICDANGYTLVDVNTLFKNTRFSLAANETKAIQFKLHEMLLSPSKYFLRLWLGQHRIEEFDNIELSAQLDVGVNPDFVEHSDPPLGAYVCRFDVSFES